MFWSFKYSTNDFCFCKSKLIIRKRKTKKQLQFTCSYLISTIMNVLPLSVLCSQVLHHMKILLLNKLKISMEHSAIVRISTFKPRNYVHLCIYLYCVNIDSSNLGHKGKNSGLAAVVTLGSSLDYTTSRSSLKFLLPLVSEIRYLLTMCNNIYLLMMRLS